MSKTSEDNSDSLKVVDLSHILEIEPVGVEVEGQQQEQACYVVN